MFKHFSKQHLILTIALLLSNSAIFGQTTFTTYSVDPISDTRILLAGEVSHYSLFQLSLPSLNRFIKSEKKGNTLEFAIDINGRAWNFKMEETPILSPNFKAIEMKDRVENDITETLAISTLAGVAEHNEQNTARMTISEEFLEGFFQYEGDIYFLSPLTRFTKNSKDLNTYIFYKYTDWLGSNFCKNDTKPELKESNEKANPAEKSIKEHFGPTIINGGIGCGLNYNPSIYTTVTPPCNILQIAADGDFEFVTAWGTAAAASASIIASITSSEPGYLASFSLRFQITSVTLFDAATDPYPNETPATGMITDAQVGAFITAMTTAINTRWGVGNPTARDLVQVFTGVAICNTTTVPTSRCTAGGCPNAWQTGGTICSATVQNVIGFCVPNFTSVAHEIGHSFGGVHPSTGCGSGAPPTQPCAPGGATATIMCPNFCPDRGLGFDAANSTTIQNTINAASCVRANISGPSLICGNVATTYSINGFFIPQAGVTVTWTVGSGLTITASNDLSVTVVGNSTYLGPTFVQATMTGTLCNSTIRGNFYLNGIPPYDCESYQFCPNGEYEEWVVPASIAIGHTVSNLHCDSPNCPNLDYYISPSNNIYIYAGSAPGTYLFTYKFTTPCGSFLRTFRVTVYRSCTDGGIGLVTTGTNKEETTERNGIKQPTTEKDLTNFNLRPNPASSQVNVDFFLTSEQVVSLELLNAAGQIMAVPFTKSLYTEGPHSILVQLEGMPKGIYTVKLTTDDKVYVKKLITD